MSESDYWIIYWLIVLIIWLFGIAISREKLNYSVSEDTALTIFFIGLGWPAVMFLIAVALPIVSFSWVIKQLYKVEVW